MQLIGAHEVLRLLRDLAVLGGEQFGGNGGVEDVQQDVLELCRGGNVGFVPDEMAHQRFGHARVHAVHAHVVAVVGGPAQRQFGKVAGAHHEAAGAVGGVHQLQCPDAGLTVLERHVQHAFILPDVGKMAVDGVGDVDLGEADVQFVAQNFRIAAGALGGAEAGHGHGQHIGGGAAQLLHGADGHQQSKAAVQPAGDADDRRFGVGVFQPLGKAVGLHLQDQFAALGAALGVAGNEGGGVHPAGQHGVGGGQAELHRHIAVGGGFKAGVAGPLGLQPLTIQLGLGAAARKGSRLGQQGAVFGNEVVARKDHVLRALAVPGGSVQVTAEQTGGLVLHQCPAIFRLAHGLVAGRKVRDDGGPGEGVEGGGRQGAPQILADLDAQHEARHLPAAEEQRGAEGHLLAADRDGLHLGGAGGELALFVELAVVGQVGLGHKTQQLPAAEDGSAVVQLAPRQQRQPHQRHHVQLPAGVQDRLQAGQRALLQGALQKQVAAGVAGQAELREDRELDPAPGSLAQLLDDLGGVIGAVRHPQRGREGCCFQKSIFHRRISHPVCCVWPRRTDGPLWCT